MKKSKKGLEKKNKREFFYYLLRMSIDFYRNWCYKPWCIFQTMFKFDIIFLKIFDGTKRILFHKGGDTKPIIMKQL